ncbi:hypothetical protein Q5P01_021777 [Channa striata]|uniref:Uncharacterized protein n=1 Tax=Channa striata TaxID=64152 RepID=A0AA88S0X6_CHASR|nr:hypothetical protein Q5P01_021777 [Channa striata]
MLRQFCSTFLSTTNSRTTPFTVVPSTESAFLLYQRLRSCRRNKTRYGWQDRRCPLLITQRRGVGCGSGYICKSCLYRRRDFEQNPERQWVDPRRLCRRDIVLEFLLSSPQCLSTS